MGSRQYILTDRLVASIVLLHLQEARLCFAASIVLLQRPDGAFAVALSCFVSGASVLPGSSSCLPHLMLCNLCGKRMWHQAEDRVEAFDAFSAENCPWKSPQGASRRALEPPKMPFRRSRRILERVGLVREVPQGLQRQPRSRPKASKHRPRSAPGRPRDTKDAAEAPRAASDWLFLVAKGLLDSSPALLLKSSFYDVKS